MIDVHTIVQLVSPEYSRENLSLPFADCGLDSFDLLEVRMRLESATAHHIPDDRWVAFRSFRDIDDYFARLSTGADTGGDAAGLMTYRRLSMNMPQMALGGLSEHWLFKELGDMHWSMTCEALNSESHNVLDGLGNRLYATFVRVRLESTHHLKRFHENETLELDGRLSRFGKSMFFSRMALQGEGKTLDGSLMTTFSMRRSNNKDLLKGEPIIPEDSAVAVEPEMPALGEEYRQMRKGNLTELVLGGETIPVRKEPLCEIPYKLNPYHDLNGVNLLYFAAYPTISDFCEAQFIEEQRRDLFRKHWPLEASTVARDVFYYGNCDLDDSIIFAVNACEVSGRRLKIATSLLRRSDRQLLANLFAVKEIHE